MTELNRRENASRCFDKATPRKPFQATPSCSSRTCTHQYIEGISIGHIPGGVQMFVCWKKRFRTNN